MKLRVIGLVFALVMTALVTFGAPEALTRLYLAGDLSFLDRPGTTTFLNALSFASIGFALFAVWSAWRRRREVA